MAFAEKLKALRLENKMTQENVAECVNLSRSTIAGYESKNRQPSYDKLSAFVELFHVSMDELLEDGESAYTTADESHNLNNEGIDFMIRYQRLPENSKKALLKHLKELEIQAGIEDM